MRSETEGDASARWSTAPNRVVSAGGVDFAYRELGPRGGVPVVFLHHFTAVLDDWDPRVIDGVAQHRHVVAFDNRGVGATTGRVPADVEKMGEDARAFIRALGHDRVDLFGFSLGGVVAQLVTLSAPDLVRRLVLAGTSGRGGHGNIQFAWNVPIAFLRSAWSRADPRYFLFFPRTREGKRAAHDYLARLAERTTGRDEPIAAQARLAQLVAILRLGLGTRDDLESIVQPVFVANGDNDLMAATKESIRLARRLPNCQLTIYPNSGHGGVFQYHDVFVPALVDFLRAP